MNWTKLSKYVRKNNKWGNEEALASELHIRRSRKKYYPRSTRNLKGGNGEALASELRIRRSRKKDPQ